MKLIISVLCMFGDEARGREAAAYAQVLFKCYPQLECQRRLDFRLASVKVELAMILKRRSARGAGRMLLVQRWQDQESLKAHLETPATVKFLTKWADRFESEFLQYDVSRTLFN
jgi:hypothetical protein